MMEAVRLSRDMAAMRPMSAAEIRTTPRRSGWCAAVSAATQPPML